MNINKILIIAVSMLGIILFVLVGIFVVRRNSVQKISNTYPQNSETESVPESDTQRLEKIAQDNPRAAVEGIRSPTPMPPNTLTITDKTVEPLTITQMTGKVITVVNKTNGAFEIWVKTVTEEAKKSATQISANSTAQLNLEQTKKGQVTILFVKQGTSVDKIHPAFQADVYLP